MDYKTALLTQLDPTQKQQVAPANNSGVAGGRPSLDLGGMGEPGGFAGPAQGFGDTIKAQSIYDTSGMSDAQKAAMSSATQAQRDKDTAGAQADADYLAQNGGNWGSRQQYRPSADPTAGAFGGKLVGGSEFDAQQQPQATPTTTPPPAAVGGYVSFAGFDGSKFGKDSKPGSKYTPDAAVYSKALGSGVNFDRNNLGGLVDFYKQNGYQGATSVGDDKIDPDGPGPMGPIDVIQSNGTKVYQNTTGNPQWEAQYGGGGSAAGGHAGGGHGVSGGSTLPGMLQGDPTGQIDAALGQFNTRPDFLQQLLAQLGGGQ